MKLIENRCVPEGLGLMTGSMKIITEEEEDLWLLYNLISNGDSVSSKSTRKVEKSRAKAKSAPNNSSESTRKVEKSRGVPNSSKSTRKVGKSRVKVQVEVKVNGVDYDKDKNGSILRIRGKCMSDSDHIAIGGFHTLEIELGQKLCITKKVWDSEVWYSLTQAFKRSTSKARQANMAVLVMQEGLAHLYVVGNTMTSTLLAKIDCDDKKKKKIDYDNKKKIESNNKKKNGTMTTEVTELKEKVKEKEKEKEKDTTAKTFFEEVGQAFMKHVDLGVVRFVVIGSPAGLKDRFQNYLLQEKKSIMDHKPCLVLVTTSSGRKESLGEVLENPKVKNLIKETKVAEEGRLLEEFMEFMRVNGGHGRVCYGVNSVEAAQEMVAVEKLFITDGLYRSNDVRTRWRYMELVSAVEDYGGIVHVFSSTGESGKELTKLTGIAAVLRFPLPHLDCMMEGLVLQ